MVKQGLEESDVLKTNFDNFKRGHNFELEAISVFCDLSGDSKTETWIQVIQIMVLAQMHWLHLLSAKTEGPLSSLKQMPSYYIQPQKWCVLVPLIVL